MKKFNRDEYVKLVMKRAKARAQHVGWKSKEDEANFLMGASVIFEYLDGNLSKIPIGWVFGITMTPESPCGIIYPKTADPNRMLAVGDIAYVSFGDRVAPVLLMKKERNGTWTVRTVAQTEMDEPSAGETLTGYKDTDFLIDERNWR